MKIGMARGGRAWRGYFRVGDELTSGKPDQKEGIYFGAELPPRRPEGASRDAASWPQPLPEVPPGLRETVLDYMTALTSLGHGLMAGLALSLGLEESYLSRHYTGDPLTLFRIFNYPPPSASDLGAWASIPTTGC